MACVLKGAARLLQRAGKGRLALTTHPPSFLRATDANAEDTRSTWIAHRMQDAELRKLLDDPASGGILNKKIAAMNGRCKSESYHFYESLSETNRKVVTALNQALKKETGSYLPNESELCCLRHTAAPSSVARWLAVTC